MFKFLHAADFHLDSRLHGLSRYDGAPLDRIRNACRRALENLVELALEEKVEFVLIAGDVYDGDWHDYNTGLYFVSQMTRLREAGIRVFLIAGNHDASNKMTRMLRLPDNVAALATDQPESRRIDDLGVVVHGQGFATGAVTEDLSRQYPPAIRGLLNIGLLHSCVEGTEGHDRYAPSTLQGLSNKGYDYWALGHIHKRDELRKEPFIVYSGNIQGRHIRETGPKGCYLVTVQDNRLSLEFRRLDVVRWEQCVVNAPESDCEDDLYDAAANQIAQKLESDSPDRLLVVRVTVQGRSRLHERLLSDSGRSVAELRNQALQLGEGRVWIEQVKIRTAPWLEDESVGPLEELLDGLTELRADPSRLKKEGESFRDLRDRLPAEFMRLPESPRFDDPAWLADLIDEVEALLRESLSPFGTRQ